MSSQPAAVAPGHWTIDQLRQLPPAERDAILAAAAILAEQDYRTDVDLTAFDAYDKDELQELVTL